MIYTDTDLILFSKLDEAKLGQVLNGLNARSALQCIRARGRKN